MKRKVIRTEMGHAAHFIGADECKFRRATHLSNGYIISTIGDYFPRGERERIGADRYFETYVFHSKGLQETCGCYRPSDLNEIDGEGCNTAIKANELHEEYVTKYMKMGERK